MSQLRENPARPEAADVPPDAIMVATALKKSFVMGDSTVQVLKHADLALRAGEFVAIEGRSGSGKSTLLHMLAGLDSPDQGSIEFDGTDIADLARRAAVARSGAGGGFAIPGTRAIANLVRSALISFNGPDRRLARLRNESFGFVFQFYHLLPELSVLENTELAEMVRSSWLAYQPKRAEVRDRAAALLKQLGLEHRLKHRPQQLSGGERQRVAIARALMNDPRILFADEPTGNLDVDTGRQIMDVLEKLHRDRNQTIVMVTHDRTLAREADRVLVLKDGRLENAEG